MPLAVKALVGNSQLRGTTSLMGEAVPGGWIYVNRGLSYGQRVQYWCRPEVTVFKLAVHQEGDASNGAGTFEPEPPSDA